MLDVGKQSKDKSPSLILFPSNPPSHLTLGNPLIAMSGSSDPPSPPPVPPSSELGLNDRRANAITVSSFETFATPPPNTELRQTMSQVHDEILGLSTQHIFRRKPPSLDFDFVTRRDVKFGSDSPSEVPDSEKERQHFYTSSRKNRRLHKQQRKSVCH